MKILTAADVARLGAYRDVVEALREGFRAEIETPVRHHHDVSSVSTLLLMPAISIISFFAIQREQITHLHCARFG